LHALSSPQVEDWAAEFFTNAKSVGVLIEFLLARGHDPCEEGAIGSPLLSALAELLDFIEKMDAIENEDDRMSRTSTKAHIEFLIDQVEDDNKRMMGRLNVLSALMYHWQCGRGSIEKAPGSSVTLKRIARQCGLTKIFRNDGLWRSLRPEAAALAEEGGQEAAAEAAAPAEEGGQTAATLRGQLAKQKKYVAWLQQRLDAASGDPERMAESLLQAKDTIFDISEQKKFAAMLQQRLGAAGGDPKQMFETFFQEFDASLQQDFDAAGGDPERMFETLSQDEAGKDDDAGGSESSAEEDTPQDKLPKMPPLWRHLSPK